MKDFTLLKNAGMYTDLIYLLGYRFDKEEYLRRVSAYVDREKQEKKLDEILDRLQPIPEDIRIFCDPFVNKTVFLRNRGILPYDKDLDYALDQLRNIPLTVNRFVKFAFPQLTMQEVAEHCGSMQALFALVKKSSYPDRIKLGMYEFFSDPRPMVEQLCQTLVLVCGKLEAYYVENGEYLNKLYTETATSQEFSDDLDRILERNHVSVDGRPVYVSFFLARQYTVIFRSHPDFILIYLGAEYRRMLDSPANGGIGVWISQFGAAIGDENRYLVLKMIQEKGEVTCKDVEKAFHFSGSTAYHHLAILLEARLLNKRSEGKNMLYSLNRGYFSAVIAELKKFSAELNP